MIQSIIEDNNEKSGYLSALTKRGKRSNNNMAKRMSITPGIKRERQEEHAWSRPNSKKLQVGCPRITRSKRVTSAMVFHKERGYGGYECARMEKMPNDFWFKRQRESAG
jgi:hypothetical protein